MNKFYREAVEREGKISITIAFNRPVIMGVFKLAQLNLKGECRKMGPYLLKLMT